MFASQSKACDSPSETVHLQSLPNHIEDLKFRNSDVETDDDLHFPGIAAKNKILKLSWWHSPVDMHYVATESVQPKKVIKYRAIKLKKLRTIIL